MADGGQLEELWQRLEATARAYSDESTVDEPAQKESDEDEESGAWKQQWPRVRWRLDLIGAILWPYAILKVLVIDLDRRILDSLHDGWGRYVDYRVFAYLAVLVVLAATVKKTWLYLIYLLFFPIIILGWRLPRYVYRRGSWLPVVGTIHAVSTLISSLRYHVVTKGLAVFAVLAGSVSHNRVVVASACTYLLAILALSYVRTVRNAFSGSRFLQQQDRLLDWWSDRNPFDVEPLLAELRRQQVELYPKPQLDRFTTTLSFRVVTNRLLYFWAYQLDQYRKTPATLAMNGMAYVNLFLGSAIVLTVVNLGIWHATDGQYSYGRTPSVLGMAVYSLGSLALNAGGGIEAAGDWAHAVRILAGVMGPVFLVTFFATLMLSWRRERDDSAMHETVQRLRRRAQEDEERLRSTLHVSVAEAVELLGRLGNNAVTLVAQTPWFRVPPDFIDGDGDAAPS